MGKYSRDKGVRGERMWRDVCRAEGYDVERGCQLYQRGSEVADVIGLPGIHVEWVSHADLAAAGYISVTYLGDKRNPSDEDHYMLLREDGTRDYMTGQELIALLNYVSIDRR